jgi:hypothetical protein
VNRLKQILQTVKVTAAQDPRLIPLMLALGLGVFGALLGLGFVLGSPILYGVVGLLGGLLAAIVVLGRRAEKVALAQIEGRPGAAAAVLQAMRGPWKVTPAIGFNRRQDLVHLVVGRPGVILVAEAGSSARAKDLLGKERRRVTRAAGDAPVHEVIVGSSQGEVPLRGLSLHLARLPRAIKPKEVGPLDTKLSALKQADLPLPKGPLPRAPRGKNR